MPARILSGTEAAAVWRAEIAGRVGSLAADGRRVGLATLLVGDDAASQSYVRSKHRAAEAVGMRSFDRRLPATASQTEIGDAVGELNADPEVDGFIVQLPLPRGLDPARVVELIAPGKDADGLHPCSLGRLAQEEPAPRPATPSGILRLLDHYEIPTRGKRVVIVGRSTLVGRPLSIMMSGRERNATVTVAHTGTGDLAVVTREAEILVVAAGRPGLIGPEHVAPGVVVIDVGTTHVEGRLHGDVRFDEVAAVASWISPVPGGIGPMTVAGLLANTVWLADQQA
ncbi:MAG: bifunctional methylenetetrahydrofolate dehydrogenase/methenyltetrahydrofolate cyclohydrolase [Actinobacteria bacterium RBG_16_68_21]|nr:MAG: bifunctional methylenetetrahydrofolate dehydrogenase/methenyltetrahydrofolate cyclohydrolase [Actinobacteria bacterium RBG_16_68_21]